MRNTPLIIIVIMGIGFIIFACFGFAHLLMTGFEHVEENGLKPIVERVRNGPATGVIEEVIEVEQVVEYVPKYGSDEASHIMRKGEQGIDWLMVMGKEQPKGMTTQEEFLNYLPNSKYTIDVPEDAVGGYLQIILRKNLTYMPTIGVYQPITIWTDIYVQDWGVYGRIDTTKALEITGSHRGFLFDLTKMPIKTAKHSETNWIEAKKGKTLTIGGFVSDSNGNNIDKIYFIRKKKQHE